MVTLLAQKGLQIVSDFMGVYSEQKGQDNVPGEAVGALVIGYLGGLTISAQFTEKMIESVGHNIGYTLEKIRKGEKI